MTDLDRVASEERDLLEMLAPAGVLAGERLDVARQLGEEEVDQRSSDELRDASAAAFLEHTALDDRSLVVGLDVADPLLDQQRAEGAVEEAWMPVEDVCVRPRDQVARCLVEALPECFALTAVGAVLRQHLGVDDHPGALGLGDPARVVVRVRVDHQQLVDQPHLLHQLASGGTNDGPDGRRLIQRGQDGADGDALLLLESDQAAKIAELRVVVVGLGEPAVDAGRDAAALLGRAIGGLERLGLLGALART